MATGISSEQVEVLKNMITGMEGERSNVNEMDALLQDFVNQQEAVLTGMDDKTSERYKEIEKSINELKREREELRVEVSKNQMQQVLEHVRASKRAKTGKEEKVGKSNEKGRSNERDTTDEKDKEEKRRKRDEEKKRKEERKKNKEEGAAGGKIFDNALDTDVVGNAAFLSGI
jgi:hypothetical protein